MLIGIASGGCASMIYGTKPETIPVQSKPDGATVTLRGFPKAAAPVSPDQYLTPEAQVLASSTTPGTLPNPARLDNYKLWIEKKVEVMAIVFEKDGYKPIVVPLTDNLDGGCAAIVIGEIFLALIPSLIDSVGLEANCFHFTPPSISLVFEKLDGP